MSQCGRRQQICRAGASRGGAEHKPATQVILRISCRCESHALLVLATIERQSIPHLVERLTETGDISMPEDSKTAPTKSCARSVYFDELRVQVPNDGLRGRQANGLIRHAVPSHKLHCTPFKIAA